MKFMYRARKDPLDTAISLPAPHHPVDARVVDFEAAFVIAFDWQHHPLNWLRVSIGIGAALLNDGQNGYGEACDAMM
jgi:hypothetical protein